MALDLHAVARAYQADAAAYDDADTHPEWAERVVTAVATGLAVMIVAAIAVLMGMA